MASNQRQSRSRNDKVSQPGAQSIEDFMRAREKAGLASPKYDIKMLEAMLEVRYDHRPATATSQAQQNEEILERHAAAPILNQAMSLKTAVLSLGCESDYLVQQSTKPAFKLPKMPPALTSAILALHRAQVPDSGRLHIDKLYDARLGHRERTLILMEYGIARDFTMELLHEIGPGWHPSQGQRVWSMRRWHNDTMMGPLRVDLIRPAAEFKFEEAIDSLQRRLQDWDRAGQRSANNLEERLDELECKWKNWRKGLTDALHDLHTSLGQDVKHRDSFFEDHGLSSLPKLRVPEGLDQAIKASVRKLEQDWLQQLGDSAEKHRNEPDSVDLRDEQRLNVEKQPFITPEQLTSGDEVPDGSSSLDLSMLANLDFDEEDRDALEEIVRESRQLLKEAAEYTRTLENRGIKPHPIAFNAAEPALRDLAAGISLWENHPKNVTRNNATSVRNGLKHAESRAGRTSKGLDAKAAESDAKLEGPKLRLKDLCNDSEGLTMSDTDELTWSVDRTKKQHQASKTTVASSHKIKRDDKWAHALLADIGLAFRDSKLDHFADLTETKTDDPTCCTLDTSGMDPGSDSEKQEATALTAEQKDRILREAQRKTNRTSVDDFLEEFRLEIKALNEKYRGAETEDQISNLASNGKVKVFETSNRLVQEAVDDLYEASRIDEMAWRKQDRLKRMQERRV